jgi:hypothetical protein
VALAIVNRRPGTKNKKSIGLLTSNGCGCQLLPMSPGLLLGRRRKATLPTSSTLFWSCWISKQLLPTLRAQVAIAPILCNPCESRGLLPSGASDSPPPALIGDSGCREPWAIPRSPRYFGLETSGRRLHTGVKEQNLRPSCVTRASTASCRRLKHLPKTDAHASAVPMLSD